MKIEVGSYDGYFTDTLFSVFTVVEMHEHYMRARINYQIPYPSTWPRYIR